jgi:diaminohydroxyphosphoribosylaminopyrimidine deaminase/5-amino-6-(5-phosphoribosylamino)uracil reductase
VPLPWLCLKMAVTLDGKIADREGGSKWITGEEARQYVQLLRSQCDAIMVGAGTARADDPGLTVRIDNDLASTSEPSRLAPKALCDNNPSLLKRPIKVVIDPTLSTFPSAKLFLSDDQPIKTIVFCSHDPAVLKRAASVFPPHVEVIPVGHSEVSIEEKLGPVRLDLKACLMALKQYGVNKVLCEGGALLAGSLLDNGLVDEAYWFVAAKILCDEQSLPAVSSSRCRLVGGALNLRVKECKVLGDDVLIHALLNKA